MSYPMIEIGDLMLKRNGSVDPSKFPDETFELHSIPAFDKGTPDIVKGSEIGSSKQLVQENDVMISKIVPHIRRASVVCPKGDYRQIASGEWIVFRSDKIYPDYLKHVLISDTFNKQFMATVSGVGGSLLRARPAFVAKIKIALPPLAEQRRIASILDQADELRQKRQQAIEKLDQLLQATFIDMFGDPVSNPKGWEKKKISQVLNKLTDGTHHSPPAMDEGIPYITAKHIKEGFIDFYSKPTFVSIEDHKAIYSRCDPKFGDVLYIKDGATTGIASINYFDFEFSLLSSVALLRPNPKLLTSDYLESWLNHKTVKQNILQNMGGAAIKRLTLAKIKDLDILVPSLENQNLFSKVKRQIYIQRQILERSLHTHNYLFQSLQNRAFNSTL